MTNSRSQRVAGLAVAAVAVAIAMTAVAHVHGQPDENRSAPSPAEGSPVAVSPTTPTQGGLAGLPTGAAPRVPHVDRTTYVEPDGRRTRLRPAPNGIGAATSYRGGFLASDPCCFEGTVLMTQYDVRGRRIESWCSGGHPVLADGGRLVAWVVGLCPEKVGAQPDPVIHRRVTVAAGSSDATQSIPPPEGEAALLLRVAGMWGEQVIYVDHARAWVTDLVHAPRRIPGVAAVGGVDDARGLVAARMANGTGAVVDLATGRVVWSTTEFELSTFSPDGTHLLGLEPLGPDGSGGTRYVILDAATGEQVATVAGFGDGLRAGSHIWEDDDHLLIAAFDDTDTDTADTADAVVGSEAIVRVDLSGRLSLATAPRPRDAGPPNAFGSRPLPDDG